MDAINLEVLKQLQGYAMEYFNAIVELNQEDGKCILKPGEYSAKDMAADPCKTFGQYYVIPRDEKFDEMIEVSSGTFRASFPYRQIFRILSEWESMCKAGKLKAVFEIGDVEILTAKVLTSEKTALGAYKEKKMKLQKVIGNWFVLPKRKKNEYQTMLYYKAGNLIFEAGNCSASLIDEPEKNKDRFEYVEKGLTKSIQTFAEKGNEYYKEVVKRLDHDKPTKDFTPFISSLLALLEEVSNAMEILSNAAKEMNREVIATIFEASEIFAKLGCILEMMRKAQEIEELAAVAGIDTNEAPPVASEIQPKEETPPIKQIEPAQSSETAQMVTYIVAVRRGPEKARKRLKSEIPINPTSPPVREGVSVVKYPLAAPPGDESGPLMPIADSRSNSPPASWT